MIAIFVDAKVLQSCCSFELNAEVVSNAFRNQAEAVVVIVIPMMGWDGGSDRDVNNHPSQNHHRPRSGKEKHININKSGGLFPGLGGWQNFVYVVLGGHSLLGRKTHKQNLQNPGTIPRKTCLCVFVCLFFAPKLLCVMRKFEYCKFAEVIGKIAITGTAFLVFQKGSTMIEKTYSLNPTRI